MSPWQQQLRQACIQQRRRLYFWSRRWEAEAASPVGPGPGGPPLRFEPAGNGVDRQRHRDAALEPEDDGDE